MIIPDVSGPLGLVLAILAKARKDLTSTSPRIYREAVIFIAGEPTDCIFWCEVIQQEYTNYAKECECLMTRGL